MRRLLALARLTTAVLSYASPGRSRDSDQAAWGQVLAAEGAFRAAWGLPPRRG
jgi:hypothetical protein